MKSTYSYSILAMALAHIAQHLTRQLWSVDACVQALVFDVRPMSGQINQRAVHIAGHDGITGFSTIFPSHTSHFIHEIFYFRTSGSQIRIDSPIHDILGLNTHTTGSSTLAFHLHVEPANVNPIIRDPFVPAHLALAVALFVNNVQLKDVERFEIRRHFVTDGSKTTVDRSWFDSKLKDRSGYWFDHVTNLAEDARRAIDELSAL